MKKKAAQIQAKQLIEDKLAARRRCLSGLVAAGGSALLSKANASEKQQAPLSFEFIKNPPGKLYSVGDHRLHAWCTGSGNTTVLLEPGLGGSSLEWMPLAEELSQNTRVCLYDRGGYAWSDPGNNPRHVVILARELKSLLSTIKEDSSLILVGHSYGGLIMRQLAAHLPDQVKGLILVDASHEDQFQRLSNENNVAMLPSSRHFVVNTPEIPENLRQDVRNKILAFSRMRKTYAALHAEIESFADSCKYIRENKAPFDFPVTVISRGLDPYAGATPEASDQLSDDPDSSDLTDQSEDNREKIWHELQSDLLNLSPVSKQIIARQSGHHIHIDQPQIIKQAILDLLDP